MKRYLVFFLIIFYSYTVLDAATFHAIIMADTESNLNKEINQDLRLMDHEMNKLSRHLNLPLNKKVLTGKTLSSRSFFQILDQMPIQKDDILFLFYSGHGFRERNKESPFPYLHLLATREALDMDLVIDKIRKKRFHFALIVADTCNNIVNEHDSDEKAHLHIPFRGNGDIQCQLKPLFMGMRGIMAIASSSPGQVSWASPKGGYFILAFLDALHHSKASSWQMILNNVTRKIGSIQTPIYQYIKI